MQMGHAVAVQEDRSPSSNQSGTGTCMLSRPIALPATRLQGVSAAMLGANQDKCRKSARDPKDSLVLVLVNTAAA